MDHHFEIKKESFLSTKKIDHSIYILLIRAVLHGSGIFPITTHRLLQIL
jgi:hypothetical protein